MSQALSSRRLYGRVGDRGGSAKGHMILTDGLKLETVLFYWITSKYPRRTPPEYIRYILSLDEYQIMSLISVEPNT